MSEREMLSALEGLARLRERLKDIPTQLLEADPAQSRLAFTPDEAARAAQDAAFLAEKLGLALDAPRIPAIQEQLRQMLADAGPDTEELEG